MGCGNSKEDYGDVQTSKEIDDQIIRDKQTMQKEVKILLLGAGESGKSTVVKQMKLIHENGYTYDERESFKEIIFSNCMQSARALLEAMDTLEIDLENPRNQINVDLIMDTPTQIESDDFPPELMMAIKSIWSDGGVRECFSRSSEYQLNDSASYEYDQVLIEDESSNRMHEALTLFDSICNSRWFSKTSIILFLNKIDLFKEKLPKSPLENHFPDYKGGQNIEAAKEYLLQRFTSLNLSKYKQIYTYYTCATDTNQVKFVMTSVNDIIIQNHLRDIGII
ncbi:Guanine nucleotide-binding protein subunit alpha [Zancudomyces culisetae]|uniref:Guanine nucleotide-binding protein subunit alpha n=1 Tax=Zancudomyces culisetae TaxID=1213189 RepID=A0A1R1PJZ0_ZANCU|nr:Guanine nucleotide-binding protein subunit alpha [Zancudomyces culisetae]|eukprot:OMH81281.1 Guanine nucleotide-binding protein subunit alpha [Zancudomyces culisetae]